MIGYNLVSLVLICQICVAMSMICQYTGEMCSDDEQCCGGCCFFGECVDTYRSCMDPYDVCKDHACIGEEECVVYVPPECPGCEPLPMCQNIDKPTEYK